MVALTVRVLHTQECPREVDTTLAQDQDPTTVVVVAATVVVDRHLVAVQMVEYPARRPSNRHRGLRSPLSK
jgi:hypothetical protein